MPSDLARRVRLPGYLLIALMVSTSVGEFLIGVLPYQLHSPTWRLNTTTAAIGTAGGVMFALFVGFVLALAAEDRRVLTAFSIVFALIAAFLVCAIGAFGLDALQVRQRIQGPALSSYDLGALWTTWKLIAGSIVAIVLASRCFKSARSTRRDPVVAGMKAPPLISRPVRQSAASQV